MSATLIHASCVARFGRGVLIRGDSGAGKSTLALQLINVGWMLVADDYTELSHEVGQLIARAPARLRGWLEVAGLGVCPQPALQASRIDLIVDLAEGPMDRLPEPRLEKRLNIEIAYLKLPKRFENAPALVVEALRNSPNMG